VKYKPFHRPEPTPEVSTLWDFPSQNYGRGRQGDTGYRGATPSFVVWNLVQRFTQPGQRVVDPFCGSGTTLDVCRDLDRVGIGFDIAPPAGRSDIEKADARHLPLEDKSADLIFMDPPYADNLAYSDDPDCIGKTRADDGSWEEAMGLALDEACRIIKPGGVVALYVCDVLKKGQAFFPLGLRLAALAEARLEFVDHVAVVRKNKQLRQGNHRKAALDEGFFLRGFNHLLLFRRSPDGPDNQWKKGQRRPDR
jgi:DNA modification methylase